MKKRIVLTIIVFACMMLTGCDVHDIVDSYEQTILVEGERNKTCVDKLVSMGLMTESTGDGLKKHIDKEVDRYNNVSDKSDFASESKECVSYVITAQEYADLLYSKYSEYYNSAYEEDGETKFSLDKPSYPKIEKLIGTSKVDVTSYNEWKKTGKLDVKVRSAKNPPVVAKNVKQDDRITFLSLNTNDADYFETLATIPVYVLRSNAFNGGGKDGDLDWYKKKYGDPEYTEYASIESLINSIGELKSGKNKKDNESVLKQCFMNSGTTLTEKPNFIVNSELKFKSNGIESLSLATVSFDAKAIEDLYGSLESVEGKYFIYNNVAYLLEYPVYYVETIKTIKDGGDNWETGVEKSDMRVNFYSGEMTDRNGSVLKQTEETDSFYHVSKDTGSSSFIFGVEPVTYTGIGYNKAKVDNCLQVVLRDYLEYIYLPGVVTDEQFVALGRRIRIDHLWGGTGTQFGHFIDKQGDEAGSMKLLATNLIGLNSGTKKYENVKITLALKHKSSTDIAKGDSTSKNGLVEGSDILLDKLYVPSLRISYPFGANGAKVGKIDISNNEKKGPVIYGIATDISLFDSGLYAEWVNVADDGGDIGSLNWWIKWLPANMYKYMININNLSDSLNDKYGYELAEEGNIILDLNTIGKIQEEYNKEEEISKVTGVRTAFLVLGTLLIAYSLLLLAAWVIDVNITNGPGLLTKLSFGHWVAVISTDEIPSVSNGVQYYNFPNILIKAMIICGIGMLLYLIDFVDIVGMVWSLFGKLADMISEKIFNIF